MFQFIFLLLGFSERKCEYITYAEGDLQLISSGQVCRNSAVLTSTVTFPGTFNNDPQMIFFLTFYAIPLPDYKFTISYTASKTSSTIKLTCFTSTAMATCNIKWVAVDDQRIKVINYFVNLNGKAGASEVISHGLTNAKTAFATYNYFTYSGLAISSALDISVELSQITSTSVTIKYADVASLSEIGLQLILGTEDTFTLFKSVSFTPTSSDQKVVSLQADYYMLFVQQAIQLTINIYQTVNFQFINVNDGQSATLSVDANSYQYGFQYASYQVLGLSKISYMVDYPLLCTKIRITKKKYTFSSNLQVNFQVNGDKTTAQTINTNYQQTFKKSPGQYSTLDLIVSLKCTTGKRILGQVLQCIDCKIQNIDLSAFCYGGMNFVEYRIKLFQKDQVYQQVTIDITQSKVQILQLVKGPKNSTVLSIEIQ